MGMISDDFLHCTANISPCSRVSKNSLRVLFWEYLIFLGTGALTIFVHVKKPLH